MKLARRTITLQRDIAMKFFIPAADSPEHEASVYESIKTSLKDKLGAEFSDWRIQCLDWVHKGKEHSAIVGEITTFNGETVIAILYEDARRLYHVCTENRGVLRDWPILAGESSVKNSAHFDPE